MTTYTSRLTLGEDEIPAAAEALKRHLRLMGEAESAPTRMQAGRMAPYLSLLNEIESGSPMRQELRVMHLHYLSDPVEAMILSLGGHPHASPQYVRRADRDALPKAEREMRALLEIYRKIWDGMYMSSTYIPGR